MSKSQVFSIQHHQSNIPVQPTKLAIYQQMEVVEAIHKQDVYYLFFYKYTFIQAIKATKLKRKSFIQEIFTKGEIFEYPHPFFYQVLASNRPYKMNSFSSLLKKLKKNYTPQEVAFLLTCFESFYPKKQLYQEIKTIFFEFRRNGQMLRAYQIIRILKKFAPNSKFVQQIANDMSFQKFTMMYEENKELAAEKDSLYKEQYLLANVDRDSAFERLVKTFQQESRPLDIFILYMKRLKHSPSITYYEPLKRLLKEQYTTSDTVVILESMSQQAPSFKPIFQDLFDFYIEVKDFTNALQLKASYPISIKENQMMQLSEMLEDIQFYQSINQKELNEILTHFIPIFPEKEDTFLHHYVQVLLQQQELPFVYKGIQPLKEICKGKSVFDKLEKMLQASEELEEMQRLGEWFFEFKQYEKAIECFSWEMELQPQNPKPLQWLAKVYLEMGMQEESNMYRKLSKDLQKLA